MTDANERGLAVTEATLALPVLALLMAGALHLHGVLRAKLAVGIDARRAAWAMRDDPRCGSGGGGQTLEGGSDFPGYVATLLPAAMDAIFDYARASEERTLDAMVVPLTPDDGSARQLRARAVVTCNEPGWDGLVDALGAILGRAAGL